MPDTTTTTDAATERTQRERTEHGEVTKIGNLTQDPTLLVAEGSGKTFARLRLAVNWPKNKPAKFYDLVVFDEGMAMHCAESLHRGMRVIVTGRGQVRYWGDPGDEKRSPEIIVNGIGPDLRWATAEVAKGNVEEGSEPDDDEF